MNEFYNYGFLFHEKSQKLGPKERENANNEWMNFLFFNCMEIMELGLESGTRVLN